MLKTTEQYQFFDTLVKGGWVMIPLAVCSFVALAVIIERFYSGPRRSRVIPEGLFRDIEELIRQRRFAEAAGLCRANNTPLARISLAAVHNVDRGKDAVTEAVEAAGRKEAHRLQRFLGLLGTIAAVAPLLGLLGTVFGMITTFSVIEGEGVGNAQALSGGISAALITTATGLTIAIPSMIFHRFFVARSKSLIVEMEENAAKLVDEMLSANGEELRDVKSVQGRP